MGEQRPVLGDAEAGGGANRTAGGRGGGEPAGRGRKKAQFCKMASSDGGRLPGGGGKDSG